MSPRKVCVVLVDRANYGRLAPVVRAIREEPRLHLQLLAAGTMVLERFGSAKRVVEQDGFEFAGEVFMELEGSTPATMAKSVGIGIMEFASEFQRLDPDIVLIIGDRYEALSATIAAAYMNKCIVHLQGGEVSGSIDESARHAITKFAHFHFPATKRSAEYLVRMGERPETLLGVGCPSSDIAAMLDPAKQSGAINETGMGATIDPSQPYLLTLFHPTTTEFGGEVQQMEQVLAALDHLQMPTVLLWPNIDAGSDHISKAIRRFRTQKSSPWLRTLTNLEPETYLSVLASAACAVGNSSSFVRDAGYFGTPVVLVGNRQQGREWGPHVTPVNPESEAIIQMVNKKCEHGRYDPITLYGNGKVSQAIVEGLLRLEPYAQKQLNYVEADQPVCPA